MHDLEALLRAHHFYLTPSFDGRLLRFDRAGKGTGWWRGVRLSVSGQDHYHAKFGDWKTGESFEWASSEAPEVSAAYAQWEEEDRAARAALQEKVRGECQALWADAIDRGDSPYLRRKTDGLPGLHGCRLDPANPSTTLVPAYDLDGTLWGLQSVSEEGTKSFTEGMRIQGCAHIIGWLPRQVGVTSYILCEGVATGASIHAAIMHDPKWSGTCVLSCFNASNLVKVARALWESGLHQGAGVACVVAADNDQWTTKPDGTAWNPGLQYAREAAKLLGARLTYPRFKALRGRPTDFNDLHVREGLPEVALQLDGDARDWERPEEARASGAMGRGPTPMPPRKGAKGQPLPPAQQSLVDHLLSHFQGNLLKQEKDLFWYTGTHWQWLRAGEHDRIKVTIQEAAGGQLGFKDIRDTFNLLVTHLPTPPEGVDMFMPNPFVANFLNGTLHLTKAPPKPANLSNGDAAPPGEEKTGEDIGPGDSWRLWLAPHRREDYLTNVLPYEYRENDPAKNHEFEAMLGRIFQGEADAEDKIRAIRQMFGACLMPAFPRLFMLHGRPGTGKSTILQIARRLVSPANLCHVPPSEFHGFNMESMAGKLVNLDTDIPLDMPLRDEIVKKIIERKPFRIRRKGVKDLEAPLPSVHLFGGNDIPRALDGGSGAHTRRWTFIGFEKFQPKGSYRLEYWDYCFEQSPQGILNFAIEGLKDLCGSGGHFLQPRSGAEKMAEWQLASDPVGLFLADLSNGEVITGQATISLGQGLMMPPPKVWEAFKAWHDSALPGRRVMGKYAFLSGMRSRGFTDYRTASGRFLTGIGVK